MPLWLMEPKEVTPVMHDEFYRFVANAYDRPRFVLHYKTDAPLNVRALLYIPEGKPGLFDMSPQTEAGVGLYCRKVLIKNKAENILPKWLRFCKGVVDSEDIPLNLSRELLQESALIRKLRTVLTNRVLRFLHDKSVKEKEEYDRFYRDYSIFLKEGIISSPEQAEKVDKFIRTSI
jgi:TNF receptor-associated protein 1